MPAITRVGVDASAGHCFPPRPANSAGQGTIFVNSILATVVGAAYPAHTCGISTHDGAASSGSSTVFIEGKPVHRIELEIILVVVIFPLLVHLMSLQVD